MRKTLVAALAALALLPAPAHAEDPPCQTLDYDYELVTGAYGGFCDLGQDAQYGSYFTAFTLVCDPVHGTVMTSATAYDSGSATCQTFGASDDFDWVNYAVGDASTFQYWGSGTLTSSQGMFRLDVPSLQGLWLYGTYVRTGPTWALSAIYVKAPPGHVLRTAALNLAGAGLPDAPTYPFAATGGGTIL